MGRWSRRARGRSATATWIDPAAVEGEVLARTRREAQPAPALVRARFEMGADGKLRVEPSLNAPVWLAALPLPEQPPPEAPQPAVRRHADVFHFARRFASVSPVTNSMTR